MIKEIVFKGDAVKSLNIRCLNMSDTGDTSIVTTGMNVAIAVCIELPALFLSLILETPLKCKKKFPEQAEVGWAVRRP